MHFCEYSLLCVDCKAYALESINTLRKYSAMLDIPISYLLSSYWYIISLEDRKILKVRACVCVCIKMNYDLHDKQSR
jgi:glucan phosphoethanolaminetransferase (alkaline phosphatase superfamily)